MKNSILLVLFSMFGLSTIYSQELIPRQKENWGSNAPWGYKDDKGNLVIPYKYSSAGFFEENGLAVVSIDNKSGFIDKSGNAIIPLIYDEARPYSQDLAPLSQKGKWGFIDSKGSQVIPFIYDEAYPHNGGLAGVKRKGKWGYIDIKGKTIIPFQYDYAGYFNQGLAPVRPKGVEEIGFINTKGEMVIAAQFKATTGFEDDGTASVLKENFNMDKYFSIDKTGKKIEINELVAKMNNTQAAEAIAKNALEFIDAGNFETALSEVEKALNLDPNNFTALFTRGFIYVAYNKDNTKAMEFYSKAISVNGNDSRPFLFRAYILVDTDNFAEAQKELDQGIAVNSKCYSCFMLRAYIFEKQKKWVEARNAASLATFADPYSQYAKYCYERYKILAEPQYIASNQKSNINSISNPIHIDKYLNGFDEPEYKENPAYARKKNRTNLSQSDMDNIIKSTSSSQSSGESGWDKYFRERDKQSNSDYKIKNNGY